MLRREAPRLAKTLVEIGSAERPEGGVPGSTFAGCIIRPGGYIPALHDFLQEAVLQQALPMDARKVTGADGNGAAILQLSQSLKRGGQFFGRRCHVSVARLGFCAA